MKYDFYFPNCDKASPFQSFIILYKVDKIHKGDSGNRSILAYGSGNFEALQSALPTITDGYEVFQRIQKIIPNTSIYISHDVWDEEPVTKEEIYYVSK